MARSSLGKVPTIKVRQPKVSYKAPNPKMPGISAKSPTIKNTGIGQQIRNMKLV